MNLIQLDEVDSTNSYAMRHFHDLPDCTLVTALSQTAGRGRQGRKWLSPPNRNIYASWVLRNIENPGFLAGLGVLHFLRANAPGHDFFLKWPNDIYCGRAKIAGILCEGAEYSSGRVVGAVAGMGININMSPGELASIDQAAVSLRSLCGHEFNLIFLLPSLDFSLHTVYIRYSKRPDLLFADWKKENRLIGREIVLAGADGLQRRGVFSGVAPDGGLILSEPDGRLNVFRCGDVHLGAECF